MSDDYPTDHDAERCLLSCVMRGGGGVRQRAVSKLEARMFDKYSDLAAVVLDVAKEGRPDPDTVRAAYGGSEDDIDEVLERRPSPQQVDRHIRAVQQAYGKLELMDIAFDAVQSAKNGHTFEEVATELEADVIDLTRRAGGSEERTRGEVRASIRSRRPRLGFGTSPSTSSTRRDWITSRTAPPCVASTTRRASTWPWWTTSRS